MLHTQLQQLRASVHALQQKEIGIMAFCGIWRAQTSLFNSLPPKYEAVAENLLVRLETGSLFAEESCSFSQDDLIGHLSVWLDKAETTLAPHKPQH